MRLSHTSNDWYWRCSSGWSPWDVSRSRRVDQRSCFSCRKKAMSLGIMHLQLVHWCQVPFWNWIDLKLREGTCSRVANYIIIDWQINGWRRQLPGISDTIHSTGQTDLTNSVLSLLYAGGIGLLVTIITDHLVRFCLLLAEYTPVRTGRYIYIPLPPCISMLRCSCMYLKNTYGTIQ